MPMSQTMSGCEPGETLFMMSTGIRSVLIKCYIYLFFLCVEIGNDISVFLFVFIVGRIGIFCLSKWETVLYAAASNTLGSSQKDKIDSKLFWKYIWKVIQETSAAPLSVPLRVFLYPFPSTYFHSQFLGTICPSFFISHHFSVTVSPNPSLSGRCPWKGGPLFDSAASLKSSHLFFSPTQSIIPLLHFSSHLFTSSLISSLTLFLALLPSLPTLHSYSLQEKLQRIRMQTLLGYSLDCLLFLFDPSVKWHCTLA